MRSGWADNAGRGEITMNVLIGLGAGLWPERGGMSRGNISTIQCLCGFDGWIIVAAPEGRVCHETDLVLDVCGMGGVCHVGGG